MTNGWITPRIALATFGWLLATLALFFGLSLGLLYIMPTRPGWDWILAWLINGAALSALGAMYWGILRRHDKGWADLGFVAPARSLWPLIWQVPLAMIAGAALQGLAVTFLLPPGTPSGQEGMRQTLANGLSPAIVLVGVGIALLTPLWEEALFRGFILQGLASRFPLPAAIALTGAAFAAFHMLPAIMPYLFVLGTTAAWLTVHYRSIWPAVALHTVNNGTLTLAAVAGLAA